MTRMSHAKPTGMNIQAGEGGNDPEVGRKQEGSRGGEMESQELMGQVSTPAPCGARKGIVWIVSMTGSSLRSSESFCNLLGAEEGHANNLD